MCKLFIIIGLLFSFANIYASEVEKTSEVILGDSGKSNYFKYPILAVADDGSILVSLDKGKISEYDVFYSAGGKASSLSSPVWGVYIAGGIFYLCGEVVEDKGNEQYETKFAIYKLDKSADSNLSMQELQAGTEEYLKAFDGYYIKDEQSGVCYQVGNKEETDTLGFLQGLVSGGHYGFVSQPYVKKIHRGVEVSVIYDKKLPHNDRVSFCPVIKDRIVYLPGITRGYIVPDTRVVFNTYDFDKEKWGERLVLANSVSNASYESLTSCFQHDVLICAWTLKEATSNHSRIYFCNKAGEYWSKPQEIAGFESQKIKLLVDSSGKVYMLGMDLNEGIRLVSYNGDRWSFPQTIIGGSVSYFDSVIKNNQLHVVHVVTSEYKERQAGNPNSYVYYSVFSLK